MFHRVRPVRFALPVWIAIALAAAPAHAADATAPQRARQLMERGHWKQARALLEPEFRARPADPAVLSALAEVRIRAGADEEAQKLAEEAVRLAPRDAQAQASLSEVVGERAGKVSMFKALGYAGKFRKAAEAALALDPTLTEPRFALMVFHLKAPKVAGGDKKKAREHLEAIAARDAALGELAMARFARETGDTLAIEGHYRRAIEKDPGRVEARLALAGWAAAPWRANWKLAEEQARAAMAAGADLSPPRSLLAGLYARGQRWDDLDALLADSDRQCPDDRNPWYQAARVMLVESRDPERAERFLRHYLEAEPEIGAPGHAHARWRLAQALAAQGRKGEAIAELEAALRLKPDLDAAKQELKKLKG